MAMTTSWPFAVSAHKDHQRDSPMLDRCVEAIPLDIFDARLCMTSCARLQGVAGISTQRRDQTGCLIYPFSAEGCGGA